MVVRAKAKAKYEVQIEELETIEKIDDGAERRRRLAQFMSGL